MFRMFRQESKGAVDHYKSGGLISSINKNKELGQIENNSNRNRQNSLNELDDDEIQEKIEIESRNSVNNTHNGIGDSYGEFNENRTPS